MYHKTMKRWLSCVLLFALVLAFGAPASANLLYTVQNNNYTSTSVGKVVGDTATVLATNVGGNWGQAVLPITFNGADRVAVTRYPNPTPYYPGDDIRIYDPSSLNWSSPETTLSHAWLKNLRALTFMGGRPYGIGYDCTDFVKTNGFDDPSRKSAKVARWNRVDGLGYLPDNLPSHLFQYEAPSGYEANGEGLATHGNFVYALFTSHTGNYPNFVYAPNKLVKLNAELGQVGAIDLHGKNTDGGTPGAYCQDSGTLYLTSWGGNQPASSDWHPESRIEKVNLSGMSTGTLVTGQQMRNRDATWKHHFTAIVLYGNTAYVQASTWNEIGPSAEPGGEVRVYKRSVSNLSTLNRTFPIKTIPITGAWRLGMVQDGTYLWVAAGDSLYRYALPVTNASVATIFGSEGTSLYGNISAFAAIPSLRGVSAAQAALDELKQAKANAGNEKDSGGGCDAGFGWLLLLAVVPVVGRRRG